METWIGSGSWIFMQWKTAAPMGPLKNYHFTDCYSPSLSGLQVDGRPRNGTNEFLFSSHRTITSNSSTQTRKFREIDNGTRFPPIIVNATSQEKQPEPRWWHTRLITDGFIDFNGIATRIGYVSANRTFPLVSITRVRVGRRILKSRVETSWTIVHVINSWPAKWFSFLIEMRATSWFFIGKCIDRVVWTAPLKPVFLLHVLYRGLINLKYGANTGCSDNRGAIAILEYVWLKMLKYLEKYDWENVAGESCVVSTMIFSILSRDDLEMSCESYIKFFKQRSVFLLYIFVANRCGHSISTSHQH